MEVMAAAGFSRFLTHLDKAKPSFRTEVLVPKNAADKLNGLPRFPSSCRPAQSYIPTGRLPVVPHLLMAPRSDRAQRGVRLELPRPRASCPARG